LKVDADTDIITSNALSQCCIFVVREITISFGYSVSR